jgi:hypothetical protein
MTQEQQEDKRGRLARRALAGATVVLLVINMATTFWIAGRVAQLPEERLSNLCMALPIRLIMEDPECAQEFVEAMNVTNLRIMPKGSSPADTARASELARRVNESNREDRERLNGSRSPQPVGVEPNVGR